MVGNGMANNPESAVTAWTETDDDGPTLEFLSTIERFNRQKDREDAAGFATPTPEIVNRRTGYIQKFGARRAFDGCYVGEVLAASGCWTKDVEKALWVLAPLVEHNCGDWTVKDLLDVLPVVFHEQLTKDQREELRAAGEGASGQIVNGKLTITVASRS
jgi:hypothetical protein